MKKLLVVPFLAVALVATALTINPNSPVVLPFLKLTSDARVGQLILQPSSSTNDSGGIQFLNPASSGKTNWYAGNAHATSSVFEITPSASADGVNFNTPVVKVSTTGVGVGSSPNIAGVNSNWRVLTIRGPGASGTGAGLLEIGPVNSSANNGDNVFQIRGYNGSNFVSYIQTLVGTNASAGRLTIQTADSTGTLHSGLTVDQNGFQNTGSHMESTGAGSALLGSNSPASTLTAPYKWVKMLTSDGSVVYFPVWK